MKMKKLEVGKFYSWKMAIRKSNYSNLMESHILNQATFHHFVKER